MPVSVDDCDASVVNSAVADDCDDGGGPVVSGVSLVVGAAVLVGWSVVDGAELSSGF